ncbi:hypothetical protein HMPREF0058_1112 [Actinomyces urogenitalis DSM 15434]|uniref:Uncharacterized protein n=1 Tax=Actinomyces urogenitalis DSM 15434 TaxID=525246 RepID=C0W5G8_9ACTO|nr:hypothetical protein HMPREF0058_1112 [Actinomyces urogenitalis DSM 15434]
MWASAPWTARRTSQPSPSSAPDSTTRRHAPFGASPCRLERAYPIAQRHTAPVEHVPITNDRPHLPKHVPINSWLRHSTAPAHARRTSCPARLPHAPGLPRPGGARSAPQSGAPRPAPVRRPAPSRGTRRPRPP